MLNTHIHSGGDSEYIDDDNDNNKNNTNKTPYHNPMH